MGQKIRKNSEKCEKIAKIAFFREKREIEAKDFAPTTHGRDRTTHGPKRRKKILDRRRADEKEHTERV